MGDGRESFVSIAINAMRAKRKESASSAAPSPIAAPTPIVRAQCSHSVALHACCNHRWRCFVFELILEVVRQPPPTNNKKREHWLLDLSGTRMRNHACEGGWVEHRLMPKRMSNSSALCRHCVHSRIPSPTSAGLTSDAPGYHGGRHAQAPFGGMPKSLSTSSLQDRYLLLNK